MRDVHIYVRDWTCIYIYKYILIGTEKRRTHVLITPQLTIRVTPSEKLNAMFPKHETPCWLILSTSRQLLTAWSTNSTAFASHKLRLLREMSKK